MSLFQQPSGAENILRRLEWTEFVAWTDCFMAITKPCFAGSGWTLPICANTNITMMSVTSIGMSRRA